MKRNSGKVSIAKFIALTAAAVTASVSLSLGLAGCEEEKAEYSVVFNSCEHVEYVVNGYDEVKTEGTISVVEGTSVTFSVVLEENYTGAEVSANENELTANNGLYSFTVTEDTQVTVTGVTEVGVTLSGSGTVESPYIISSLRELNYVADAVNGSNPDYVLGYYKLGADIDCAGGNIKTIGNGATENAFFGGNFDGDGHTISNYVIDSDGNNYAGLFGIVQQYVAQGSEADDDSGVVKNLKLKDFSISAHAPEDGNVIAGSLVAYGLASKILNCEVTGGNITVTGNNYFSYAGGAVGIMQSAMVSESRQDSSTGEAYEVLTPYYAVVNSVYTSVDITSTIGFTYASGGIVGYLISYHQMAPSYVSNCYTDSRVFGAMRVGGIVGSLNDDSAIINCYSVGEYEATSNAPNAVEDYDASAGGLVGYAGLNTAVINSFSTAEYYAESVNGSGHAHSGALIGYSAPATSTLGSATVYNSFSGSDAKGTQASFVIGTLKWSDSDWKITDGMLPSLTGALPEDKQLTITVNYGGKTVGGAQSSNFDISASDYYLPVVDYFMYSEGLSEVLSSSDNQTSYGYFFDEGLTKKVPYAFAPLSDVTLYVGFADYSEVAGSGADGKTYYYDNGGRIIELTLYSSGEFVYADGINVLSTYSYDGSRIIFNDAPFARLSRVILDNDPSLNFERYSFAGVLDNGNLKIYDDSYFAETQITLTAANPLIVTDSFKGDWVKSATIKKLYSFDGNGGWTYGFNGETLSGEYAVANGKAVMTLNGGAYAEAEINASGLVAITKTGSETEYFGLESGLLGTWFDTDTGNYVMFNGYGQSYTGEVIVNVGGNVSQLIYIKDGFFGDAYADCSYTLISPSTAALFGYLNYSNASSLLNGALYSGLTGELTDAGNFRLVDNYSGEWIGEGSVGTADFSLMNFNGFGTYSVTLATGTVSSLGYVEINGSAHRVEYYADINGGLAGTFTYNNIVYSLTFDDEKGEVTVSDGTNSASLSRKDELYTYTLADSTKTYTFNGGGNLSNGGTLTVTSLTKTETYTYKITSGSIEGGDLTVSLINDQTKAVGSLSIVNNAFVFKESEASKGTNLSVKSDFCGNWAVSTYLQDFYIGNFDLSGNATGKFQGYDATYTMISDTCVIVSFFADEDTQATQSYIVLVDEETLAISNYPYLVSGGYVYCARRDVLYGEWTHISNQNYVIKFDGLGDCKFVNGVAWDVLNNNTYYYTSRFGNFYMWLYNDDGTMYKLNFLPRNTQSTDYFGSSSNRFELETFSPETSSVCEAMHGDTKYEFFIDGSVLIGGVEYSYELVSVSGTHTTLLIDMNGEFVTAVVDYEAKTVVLL